MRHFLVTCALCAAFFLATPTGVMAATFPEIMKVTAVTPGLHGMGLTVVQGTTIEQFDVEILGVLDGSGPSKSLILVRVSGDPIERTGGIAAGMSGSPVYVDGKLLGAVAYGFDMADHNIGLLTPAEDMVKVQALASESVADEQARQLEFPSGFEIAGQLVRGIAVAPNADEANAWHASLPSSVLIATPVATPLLVQGLSQRTMQLAEETFTHWNLRVMPGGAAPALAKGVPLEPGAALGVQLVRGDINMTSIGTVTFVTPEGGFAAFGHPYLNRGNVDFFVTSATILQTVQSMEVPFKLGLPLAPAGRLLQDRGAGIAGQLGADPESIEVEVLITDKDTDEEQEFLAEVVRDENLAAPLVAITLMEALDRGIDRIGKGTAQVVTRLELEGRDKIITRHNMFYSSTDISGEALGEFAYALEALLNNDIAAVQVKSIVVEVDVTEDRNTASIESVRTANVSDFEPGETMNVEVMLRPFRQDPVRLIMRVPIPKDAPIGPVTICVHGGGDDSPRLLEDELTAAVEEPDSDEYDLESHDVTGAEDLDKLISELFEQERNYEVVIDMYASEEEPDSDIDIDDASFTEENEENSLEKLKVKLPTSWVIQGLITFDINIVDPDSNEATTDDSNKNAGGAK